MIGARISRTPPGDAHEGTRNDDDTAAERRWENEGGGLSVVDRPMQDFAGPREAQQPEMPRR